MKKISCFLLSLVVILSFPFNAFAVENNIKNEIVSVWRGSGAGFNIKATQIQTIFKDTTNDFYYFTCANVMNKDTASISSKVDGNDTRYYAVNGSYYYSGDWAGSFWCMYDGNAISVLTIDYVPIYNDDNTAVVKWGSASSSFRYLNSSYSFYASVIDSDGNEKTITKKVNFNNAIASSNNSKDTPLLPNPDDVVVIQLGDFYSESIYDYCMNQSGGSTEDTGELAQRVSALELRVAAVEADVSELKSTLTELTTNVGYILDHVTAIYNRLGEMKTQLSTVISSLSTINNNFVKYVDVFNTQLNDLKSMLVTRFEALQNVILYGDPEGESVTEEYENKLEGLNSDFDSYNSNIGSAASYVESSGQDVAAYIKTFTEIYNGAAAVAGLGAILTFGFAIIFIIKLIGR